MRVMNTGLHRTMTITLLLPPTQHCGRYHTRSRPSFQRRCARGPCATALVAVLTVHSDAVKFWGDNVKNLDLLHHRRSYDMPSNTSVYHPVAASSIYSYSIPRRTGDKIEWARGRVHSDAQISGSIDRFAAHCTRPQAVSVIMDQFSFTCRYFTSELGVTSSDFWRP